MLYINDLPENTHHTVKLYADDSKIIGIIKSPEDADKLQGDINKIVEWSNKWLVSLNIEKCNVMHVGRGSKKSFKDYMIGMQDLLETKVERDLGILLSDDLKPRNQVVAAATRLIMMRVFPSLFSLMTDLKHT